MKKSGVVLTIVMILSVLSVAVSAQQPFIPCSTDDDCPGQTCEFLEDAGASSCATVCAPENNNADCPQGQTCEFYPGPGYACNIIIGCFIINGIDCPGFPDCCTGGDVCLSPFNCGQPENGDGGGDGALGVLIQLGILSDAFGTSISAALDHLNNQLAEIDVKIVEGSLIRNDCNRQPFFMYSSKMDDPGGQFETMMMRVQNVIDLVGMDPEAFGSSEGNVDQANAFFDAAVENEDLLNQVEELCCKQAAYEVLLFGETAPVCWNPSDCCSKKPILIHGLLALIQSKSSL